MQSTYQLNFSDALDILKKCAEYAVALHLDVAITVCDVSGHPICFYRLDRAPIISSIISMGKARSCVLLGKDTEILEHMINGGRVAALGMPLLPLEGGVPLFYHEHLVGGIGVSGASPNEDASIARFGAAHLTSLL